MDDLRRISNMVLLLCISLAAVHITMEAELSTAYVIRRDRQRYQLLNECEKCTRRKEENPPPFVPPDRNGYPLDDKDIDIIVTYSDRSGAVRVSSVKARDLSASWVWKNPISDVQEQSKSYQKPKDSFESAQSYEEETTDHSTKESQTGESEIPQINMSQLDPIKQKRKVLRAQRKELRAAELTRPDKEMDLQMEKAAIARSEGMDTTFKGKYSIWRRDYEHPNSDATLKLMRDQIIMAKAYASIAKAKNETDLYDSLLEHSRKNLHALREATSDTELQPGALDRAKAMGHILSVAKDRLHDSLVLARKLRAMIQLTEENVNDLRKQSTFLIQLAAKTIPKPIHCLSQLLMANYYLPGFRKEVYSREKLEDPSLYHYAIFSDNVIAAAVVVNSTVLHANEPEKHVFHVVTDKLNFAAMKMWFIVNPPGSAAIDVVNIDDFKWLNSSYCPVLRQLESARMKDYYFKVNNPSSVTTGSDNLKYRNPKYLSMLNHLRFYLPEVYPKLDKILFLDDDIVVQKDLTPLWSIDMKGMVNGAVETCKESFHRFDKYLNFTNLIISENFDPNACGWAFGMNIFDLKEWKKRNITGIYHYWQELNEKRTLWKLGSLPPGLITFYNLTYPLDRSWHVLGLGYDPALNRTQIDNAAVIHYNGNYKPWLDLAITKYKSYWTKYVKYDSPYLQLCKMTE